MLEGKHFRYLERVIRLICVFEDRLKGYLMSCLRTVVHPIYSKLRWDNLKLVAEGMDYRNFEIEKKSGSHIEFAVCGDLQSMAVLTFLAHFSFSHRAVVIDIILGASSVICNLAWPWKYSCVSEFLEELVVDMICHDRDSLDYEAHQNVCTTICDGYRSHQVRVEAIQRRGDRKWKRAIWCTVFCMWSLL